VAALADEVLALRIKQVETEQSVFDLKQDQICIATTEHVGSGFLRNRSLCLTFLKFVGKRQYTAKTKRAPPEQPADATTELNVQGTLFEWLVRFAAEWLESVDTSAGTYPSTYLPHDARYDASFFYGQGRHWAGLVLFAEFKFNLSKKATHEEGVGQVLKRFHRLRSEQSRREVFFGVLADCHRVQVGVFASGAWLGRLLRLLFVSFCTRFVRVVPTGFPVDARRHNCHGAAAFWDQERSGGRPSRPGLVVRPDACEAGLRFARRALA
jgi:hypothetical protein